MFNQRSDHKELMDDFHLRGKELRKNLDELEAINHWLGAKKALLKALNLLYKKNKHIFRHRRLVIADLACGSGDMLRAMSRWAVSKRIKIQLIGIDINPFMIEYAIQKSIAYPNIHYRTMDILSTEFKQLEFDIISLNSCCHHFNQFELSQLLQQLPEQIHLAIIINDLHRHWLAYYGAKIFTKIFHFSSLAKHDAPLSVLRAFRKQELTDCLVFANIRSYQLKWLWAFRWLIVILKNGDFNEN